MKDENIDASELDFEKSMEYYACQILMYKFKQHPGEKEQRIYEQALELYEKLRDELTEDGSLACVAVRALEQLKGKKTLKIGSYVIQEIIVKAEGQMLIPQTPDSFQLIKAERLLSDKLS